MLDPIGCTVDLGTSATIGQRATLPQAMVNGYRYLVEGWRLRIAAAVPDWKTADFWFCGPTAFGSALRAAFCARGLRTDDFHQELFDMR